MPHDRPDIASLLRAAEDRIAQLEQQLAEQAICLEAQNRALAHSRKIFSRASQAARIGVWECELADNSLTWTDVVYDIFDLPRGSALERGATVDCYAPHSRAELERRRSKAIAEGSSFELDAEIVTPKGNTRYMRITAQVESENGVPVRIFGMKQDITEEKLQADQLRHLAEFDQMTGLPNRARFQSKLADLVASDTLSALLLIDLDGFKHVNDTHGHAVGDSCLQEAALRLAEICAASELVARIGGDEFAVLVGQGFNLESACDLARAIIETLGHPFHLAGTPHHIGASVGIALASGASPSDLFIHADTALYAAKTGGRNTWRIFKDAPVAAEVEQDVQAA